MMGLRNKEGKKEAEKKQRDKEKKQQQQQKRKNGIKKLKMVVPAWFEGLAC